MLKSDAIEYEKRIRTVQEWILEDWPTCDIISNINAKWAIQERQAKNYIAEARKRWLLEDDLLMGQKKKLKIASLKKLKRSLQDKYKGTPLGITAILRVEQMIITLDGLRPARRLEIAGKNGNAVQIESKPLTNVDYTKLPDEILKAIANARILPNV